MVSSLNEASNSTDWPEFVDCATTATTVFRQKRKRRAKAREELQTKKKLQYSRPKLFLFCTHRNHRHCAVHSRLVHTLLRSALNECSTQQPSELKLRKYTKKKKNYKSTDYQYMFSLHEYVVGRPSLATATVAASHEAIA